MRILTEPEASLIRQYVALLGTEQVDARLHRGRRARDRDLSAEVNENVENIGARRLQTVMERLLEEVSFTASDHPGMKVTIDAEYVREKVGDLVKDSDLSKFIL